jgi:3-isopropylmalate dehydrogenase
MKKLIAFNLKIAAIGGDGTGPEVIREALKVLGAVSAKHGLRVKVEELEFNGARFQREGKLLTEQDISYLRKFHAILLGAIGLNSASSDQSMDHKLLRGILLEMRFRFDQYINLRPVKLYDGVQSPVVGVTPDNLDYVIIRENVGGMYAGKASVVEEDVEGNGTMVRVARHEMVYSEPQVERCIRYSFEFVRKRHQQTPWRGLTGEEVERGFIGKLSLVGKDNVMPEMFGDMWGKVFKRVAMDYPDVKTDYFHVDAVTLHMLERPWIFDVMVTSNMFGDIITDLAAATQGGLGVAAGGNINPHGLSMFEPIGGTAPQFTGKGVINPMAAIGALRMMMAHLGYDDIAQDIERAQIAVFKQMKSQRVEEMGFSTSEIGDMVVKELQSN